MYEFGRPVGNGARRGLAQTEGDGEVRDLQVLAVPHPDELVGDVYFRAAGVEIQPRPKLARRLARRSGTGVFPLHEDRGLQRPSPFHFHCFHLA
jgi:hypothetical protein